MCPVRFHQGDLAWFRFNPGAVVFAIVLLVMVFGASGISNTATAADNVQPAAGRAQQDVTYKDLRSIRELPAIDPPNVLVDFEATATFVAGMREFVIVQEGEDAIFVFRPDYESIEPGQRVRVRGRLAKGDLLPIISDSTVIVIEDGELPAAKKIDDFGEEHDCKYVTREFDILQTTVGAEATVLFAKTVDDKRVFIQIQHPNGVVVPDFFRIAGRRVQCTGAIGLQLEGGVFAEPGKSRNQIVGCRIFCHSSDAIKIVNNGEEHLDSGSVPMVGLPFLTQPEFPEGRFFTFAQITLVDDKQPLELVVFDGSTTVRLGLPTVDDLQPGMVVKIGGNKTTDKWGGPQFEADYVRHLKLSKFAQPEPISVQLAVETFTKDRRISVEATPLRIEERLGVPHLVLGDGESTILVGFQKDARDSLASLDPAFARKVRISGVSTPDDEHDFKLVVGRSEDTFLVERKTSVSRMVTIGLGILCATCAAAAFWIRLLKGQVVQKQQFQSIFESAGCPMMVFDGNLEIVDANPLALGMTGYSKDELCRHRVSAIAPRISETQIREITADTTRGREVVVFPAEIQARDKNLLEVEVHCRNMVVAEDPSRARYIAIFPDASERNKYAKALKEARDEAVSANMAKSRFVASMSHELRTPLNGVIGMTQLLEETQLTPTQAAYLAACRTSGETLLTVIGDVLDFSKMEAGKLKFEPRETKLIPFIENIVRATSLQQGTKNLDLASFVDPRLSRSVMVDSDRLRQVIFNLIGNAAKFTSEGSITVTVNCANLADQYADVRFVVSDTGVGVHEERIARLFAAFEQIDSSTTREHGGTGLGLTICKQIVDRMGGEIYAESVVGAGSDFIVELRLPFASAGSTIESETELVATDQRLAVMGMSEPIADLLREMFTAYHVDASFFNFEETLPKGEFDVVLLNNHGDLDSVRNVIARQPALSAAESPILIPVVPANYSVDRQKWESLLTGVPISKPFSQTRFLRPVDSTQELRQLPESSQLSMWASTTAKRRVLICEDNEVNQMFAEEICQRASIEFVIKENGRAAIETLQLDANFDAIFMDCHMPVMDGFEATRKIREMTEQGAIPRIPVIALTANALASDREICLDAGMDDYLAKPFGIEQFLAKVRLHTSNGTEASRPSFDGDQPQDVVFGLEELLSQIDDRVFVFEIAEQFASTLPKHRADLELCLKQQDATQTIVAAHRLKGAAATVKAERIRGVAFEIESAARDGQLNRVQARMSDLRLEFEKFVNVIRDNDAIR